MRKQMPGARLKRHILVYILRERKRGADMKATVRDLRYQTKGIMEAVERGETVLITRRGKVRARIVRADEPRAQGAEPENPFVGMWHDRADMRSPAAYVRGLRKGRFA